jgi:hypothetical protein
MNAIRSSWKDQKEGIKLTCEYNADLVKNIEGGLDC